MTGTTASLSNVKLIFRLHDDDDAAYPIERRLRLLNGCKTITVVHHRNLSVVRFAGRFVYIIFPGKKLTGGKKQNVVHVNVTGIADFASAHTAVDTFCSLLEYAPTCVLEVIINSSTVTARFTLPALRATLNIRSLARKLSKQTNVIASINPRFPSRLLAYVVRWREELGRSAPTVGRRRHREAEKVCCVIFFASGKCNILGLKRRNDIAPVCHWAGSQVASCVRSCSGDSFGGGGGDSSSALVTLLAPNNVRAAG